MNYQLTTLSGGIVPAWASCVSGTLTTQAISISTHSSCRPKVNTGRSEMVGG